MGAGYLDKRGVFSPIKDSMLGLLIKRKHTRLISISFFKYHDIIKLNLDKDSLVQTKIMNNIQLQNRYHINSPP